MAWIESHQNLGRHPKTKKLARLLDKELPAVVGYLHYLWWWTLEYAQDGFLGKYSDDDIKDACMWKGDANTFVNALKESGFLEEIDNELMVHDWMNYAGKLIKVRETDRERKRRKSAQLALIEVKFQNSKEREHFENFWQLYPRKQGKAEAEQIWSLFCPEDELYEKILEAVERAKKTVQWQKEDGKYIPNPAAWLKGRRWEDKLPGEKDYYEEI